MKIRYHNDRHYDYTIWENHSRTLVRDWYVPDHWNILVITGLNTNDGSIKLWI